LTALAALAIGILSLSAESGFFQPQYRLTGNFKNVLGLLPGAPVWLGGKEVGRVDQIRFQQMTSEHPVRVVLRVNENVQDRIRDDSVASIGTIGLLGDSYVEISFGSPGAAVLRDGDAIETADPANVGALMSAGRNALASINELTGSLNDVVETFSQKQGAERAVEAIDALSDIMIETREGSGLLHSLVFEPYEGDLGAGLSASLENVDAILTEVRTGDGLLNQLIYAPVGEDSIVSETRAATASLNRILAGLEAGEGPLGLLLKDPTVYEDLKVLLGGAQRSTLLRSMIRMAVEQGEPEP
jgi:phospholipid/cholesterol/gamma-HCH transport system substrate-binding protein